MENKKVLLSLKDVEVKFIVRGRNLTAIRGVTMDIYEGETLAIVGESGSGKSVLTKTFSGMLDSNGYISKGSIILNDDEISNTTVKMNWIKKWIYKYSYKFLNRISRYENGREIIKQKKELEQEKFILRNLSDEEKKDYETRLKKLNSKIIDQKNKLQLLDSKKDKDQIVKAKKTIEELNIQYQNLSKEYTDKIEAKEKEFEANIEFQNKYKSCKEKYNEEFKKASSKPIDKIVEARNDIIAKEIVLSVARYSFFQNFSFSIRLLHELRKAVLDGADLSNKEELNEIFDKVNFRVEYRETLEDGSLYGYAIINLAKVKNPRDWQRIRGSRIATVFQDPMTSLNPIIKIGKQITNVIIKHQHCSEKEAKAKAIQIMKDVGIDNAEKRFSDYPFQYSGGMRQRIVIAIALSCNPNILICDEPTTALDVTIQAQILKLIKKMQQQYHFTTIYITHDLGVVANVAERVAVLYAGQIVEYGQVSEIFYDAKHPYTWALLSSLPQLSIKGEKLYSIEGTPPSLYNEITGDAFAPRNPYCMAVDLVREPPYFKITETHYAKTWLCDPRAPKVEKPKNIQKLHESMLHSIYNVKHKEEKKD